MNIFHSATLRLTMWYMVILTVLSLLFSVIVFSLASREFYRPLGPRTVETVLQQLEPDTDIAGIRNARAQEAEHHLLSNLIVFNIAALSLGGLLSYVLARRTLRPIEEAMSAQARFSSDAAHELRTPLSVMQSEIEIALRDKKATKVSHEETLGSNLDEVHRLRALTDRLLMLANAKELQLGPASLEDVAIDAVGNVIPLAQAKKISIDNQVGGIKALANGESLTDALTILLDNAIKYSPEKSHVIVSAATKGKRVLLTVRDNGPGIDPKDQPHIFDRFYRADTSRSKTNVEGHGLGLSIAKRIMAAHNGDITLESRPGRGSAFTLHLDKA